MLRIAVCKLEGLGDLLSPIMLCPEVLVMVWAIIIMDLCSCDVKPRAALILAQL